VRDFNAGRLPLSDCIYRSAVKECTVWLARGFWRLVFCTWDCEHDYAKSLNPHPPVSGSGEGVLCRVTTHHD
jgi:hypothetical protein